MVDSMGHDPVRQDAGEVADGPELDKEERAARQLIMTLGGKPEPTALSDRDEENPVPLPTPLPHAASRDAQPELDVVPTARALVPQEIGAPSGRASVWSGSPMRRAFAGG